MFICFCFQLVSWMNQKDQIGEFACQGLKILTNFDEQSLIFSSQADCIIHPMVKQIIFINILSQMKPLLANNGLNSKSDQSKKPSKIFLLEFSSDQMTVLVDLLNHIPKSLIQNEILSVRTFVMMH